MKIKLPLPLLVLAAGLPALGFQTDIVYPWVTNNQLFRATVVINNLNPETVTVNLSATRPNGEMEATSFDIAALEQLVASSGDLFPGLGEGSGYTVRLTSDAGDITGGFVVSGTQSVSGFSPSQANVVPAAEASTILLYNYFSIDDSGFSAPVVVNMGAAEAQVTFRAYQGGQIVATTTRNVPALHPDAALAGDLFPDVAGDIFVVASSEQPLVGVAFIFNSDVEPSMANAVPLGAVPQPSSSGPTVSFATEIQPIFAASCGGGTCHLDGSVSGGLSLELEDAYAALVNASTSVPFAPFNMLLRVEPGNADDSYLYRKLLVEGEGTLYTGERMPNNQPPLPDAQIALVRTWIQEGAPNN